GLGTWMLSRWWTAPHPAAPPAPAAAVPLAAPAAPDTLAEVMTAYDRLERDLDEWLNQLGREAPAADVERVRQLRVVHGEARLLEEVPQWLAEGPSAARLSAEQRRRLVEMRRRWAECDAAAARLRAEAAP